MYVMAVVDTDGGVGVVVVTVLMVLVCVMVVFGGRFFEGAWVVVVE